MSGHDALRRLVSSCRTRSSADHSSARLMTLSIFPTLIKAYRLFFANLGVYARLIWFPAVAQFAAAVFSRNYVPRLEPESSEDLVLLGVTLEIFTWAPVIPAATAWSRLAIFGKNDGRARIAYSVRVAEWRYLWRSLVFLCAGFRSCPVHSACAFGDLLRAGKL